MMRERSLSAATSYRLFIIDYHPIVRDHSITYIRARSDL